MQIDEHGVAFLIRLISIMLAGAGIAAAFVIWAVFTGRMGRWVDKLFERNFPSTPKFTDGVRDKASKE